jgi:tetratricopeptide (TPR) repeat protein
MSDQSATPAASAAELPPWAESCAVSHLNLAAALRHSGLYADAAEHYQKALALLPDFAAAHAGLGAVYREAGRLEEARQSYEQAIRIEPRSPIHFLGLSRSMSFKPEHPCLGPLLDLARDIDSLADPGKIDLHFALAKAMADLGDQQNSFAHQLAGNALKRQAVAYNEIKTLEQLRRIQSVFTTEFLKARQNQGIPSQQPIFIVGMPRSGSTLVEQILASHPQVFGAGEVNAFDLALHHTGLQTAERQFPESAPEWMADDLSRAASEYLRLLCRGLAFSENRARVERLTDKMGGNFRYLGLIHLMLPQARIIHTRRDPIDTCLSCFSLQFANLRYTYDLGELGRYYAAYARLMDHWREVLPTGRMLEVQYERVVGDFEGMARRLIAHCGLEWDDACLRFYETQRPVRTSSMTQVRQPIYRNSIGRWRPDADILRPLLEALGADRDPASPIATKS